MRSRIAFSIVLILFFIGSLQAQQSRPTSSGSRPTSTGSRPTSTGNSGARITGSNSSRGSVSAYRGSSVRSGSNFSSTGNRSTYGYNPSRRSVSVYNSNRGPSGGNRNSSSYLPNVKETGYASYKTYLNHQRYCNNLLYYYYLSLGYTNVDYLLRNQNYLPLYFNRFYVNREPLITPVMKRLTVLNALEISNNLLIAVEELEQMLLAAQLGESIPYNDIRAKTREVRDLAEKIRDDPLVSYMDQRKDLNLTKGKDYKKIGLNAIEELKALALDLNTQFRSQWEQQASHTISVSDLSQPSYESLSKAIDKISKSLEKSAKKLKS